MIDFSLVFVAGFLGSAHCVGMCGGFVLSVSTSAHPRVRLTQQALYFIGKTLTYTVLGATVGLAGATVGATFAGVQDAISIGAGIVMLVLGLHLLGVIKHMRAMGSLMNWPPFRKVAQSVIRQHTVIAAMGLGLLNGLLPCSLVYSLLVMAAATGTMLGGALTMFVLGIATVPALFTLAWVGQGLRPAWQHQLHRVSGVVVMVLGLITMLRGTPAMHFLMA